MVPLTGRARVAHGLHTVGTSEINFLIGIKFDSCGDEM